MLYLPSVQKDFTIQAQGIISGLSLKLGLKTFRDVCEHLLHLPYRRPSSQSYGTSAGKTSAAVLIERCGTCSSKHGVLKALANEQGQADVELVLCLFQMTARNTPGIAKAMDAGPLFIIPELHTYIRWGDELIDVTKPGLHISDLRSAVEKEKTISLKELAQKKEIHRKWMSDWLRSESPGVLLGQAWQQREACIAALAET